MATSHFLQLHKQITEQKQRLYLLVQIHGYKHPLVRSCSQELDRLVVLVMRSHAS
ncbi:aspartyl-phosphate phosphatase Spo0E family protein [Bacillus sp. SRB3LM]|uniref:aspartyl-phosphate phosphatase Spo0E family protein n=1 Tax=Bacillus sp. SRB3LM TaxID=2608689 RepID=UPI0018C3B049|nr:aspartyl-phosphate phosphatase Spo0E family protein [Bacillus sp. SRB3LM]MBG0970634.1 aspartyl-phosphate phosphatase Spo0E family protein [Bacillus sp. SRB3LM]